MSVTHKYASLFSLPFLFLLAGLMIASTPAAAGDQSEPPSPLDAGREIYLKACVACHGSNGTGQAQNRVGFAQPLPDFSDCDFASREPSADWMAIVHEGGPVRGFSEIMPAFGPVLEVKEIELAVLYLKSFCQNQNWPQGELNLPRPLFTEKAFPEDELVFSAEVDKEWENISSTIIYEQRIGPRSQWELVFPFGWTKLPGAEAMDEEGGWGANLGDIAIAAKHALFHNSRSGSIFSTSIEMILPTGDSGRGFGKGTFILEPFLAYGQILPANFFIHSQLGMELPLQSEKAEKEAYFKAALGRSFISGQWGRVWSPMIELIGVTELEEGAKINWDIAPEIQVTLSTRQHVMFNIGARIPLNEKEGRSVQFVAYILWDWFDGGFFEGW